MNTELDTPAKTAARSAAVAATWQDPAVKAARAIRHAVIVKGVQHRSVGEAFKALSLPMNRHVVFRQKLKASDTGKAIFQTPGEKEGTVVDYLFTLVPNGRPVDDAEAE